jgi:hypothetical protein
MHIIRESTFHLQDVLKSLLEHGRFWNSLSLRLLRPAQAQQARLRKRGDGDRVALVAAEQ